jgi:hypothetical protein
LANSEPNEQEDKARFSMAVLDAALSHLEIDVREIKTTIKERYVKRIEFEPVKGLVYCLVAGVLLAVMAAILAAVIKT